MLKNLPVPRWTGFQSPLIWALTLLFQFLTAYPAEAADAADAAGAAMPWQTYESEAGSTNGEKLTSHTYGEIANEATHHTCVKLAARRNYVAWKIAAPANAMVIRACVPDSPDGTGAEFSVSLAVNGVFRQKLMLSSRHSWLYGNTDNGNENSPAEGLPHAFFDEVRVPLVGNPLKRSDSISIYLDVGDTAPWCVIDLVDLEQVPPPPSKPEGYLSVTDFGAVPDDGKDDFAAITACIEKARSDGRGVWIPPGVFHQTAPIVLDHVKVRGAGSWHTQLTVLGAPKPYVFAGNAGFKLSGSDIGLAGVSVKGTVTRRSKSDLQHGVSGSADRFLIVDLWVSHTNTGGWIGSCSNGVIRRCRFRDTYADGFNVNNNSTNIIVEENHSRGNGDDGLAVYSGRDKGGAVGNCRNIVLRSNRCESQRWGNGIGVYGGDEITIENNVVLSANRCSGITVSTGFESWPANGVTVSGNVFIDCGGGAYRQPWPAIYVYVPGDNLQGLVIKGNTVQNSTFDGIKIVGTKDKGLLEAVISQNLIKSPGANGIQITGEVRGNLSLAGNKINAVPKGKAKLVQQADSAQLRLQSDLK